MMMISYLHSDLITSNLHHFKFECNFDSVANLSSFARDLKKKHRRELKKDNNNNNNKSNREL